MEAGGGLGEELVSAFEEECDGHEVGGGEVAGPVFVGYGLLGCVGGGAGAVGYAGDVEHVCECEDEQEGCYD